MSWEQSVTEEAAGLEVPARVARSVLSELLFCVLFVLRNWEASAAM